MAHWAHHGMFGVEYAFKNISCFFDKQFILCHMSKTLKNKYANVDLIIL